MGLQKIGKKIKKQTAQAVQKAQSAANPSQTPKKTGATAVAKKTGQAAGQKVQYYSNKNKGGARRTGTAVKNKVGAKVKANKNTPTPYQRQMMAKANVKTQKLNTFIIPKDIAKDKQRYGLDRKGLLDQIGGAVFAAQDPSNRFHGLKERHVTMSPFEQIQADGIAGIGAWASDLRPKPKEKSDKEKAMEIVENSKRYFRNKKIARQDLSEWDRRNMNAAQQRQVQEAKLRYKEAQKAGKKEDAARAHEEAENLRGLHGYSGGAAGDQYISPKMPSDVRSRLNDQGELAWKQAQMQRQRAVTEEEIAQADARIAEVLNARGYQDPSAVRRTNKLTEEERKDLNLAQEQLKRAVTEDEIAAADAKIAEILRRQRYRMNAGDMDANGRMVRPGADPEQMRRGYDVLDAIAYGTGGALASIPETFYDWDTENLDKAYSDMEDRLAEINNRIQTLQNMPYSETRQKEIDRWIAAQGLLLERYLEAQDDLTKREEKKPDITLGQRWLQQAAEAQEIAEAGLSTPLRYFTRGVITTGQMVPGLIATAFSGGAAAPGLAIMGAQAAGQKMGDLKTRGIPAQERLIRGFGAGASATATEIIPFSRFLKLAKGGYGSAFIRNAVANVGIEMTEEEADLVAGFLMDKAAKDPKASLTLQDVLDTAIITGISSGSMNLPAAIVGSTVNIRAGRPETSLQLQTPDIQARTQEQAEAITQVQDIVSDERTQEARSLLEDTKAYNEMKQTGLYSQDELGMMRDALNERYARLAGVEEVPQTVTEPAPRTLEEAAKQRTMDVQPEMPPVQWERSKFPPSSLVGSLIDAARENNARNRAVEQLRADQAAFRAQQAQREAQAAQTQAQPVQTQTAERQAQPVGQARSMVQQSPQVQRDILARNVSAFGENGRKAIMEAYQGGDAGAYRQAFAQVYDQAVSGKTQEQITRPSALTEPQFYAAVQSGMNDRAEARPAARVAGRNKNAGVDWRDQYVRQMDRRTVKMVDGVARALGVRVIFADEGSILTGTGAQANAEIVGNVVRIEKNNPNPVRKLIGHELTHRMQDLSPETYQTFRDYVMSIPGAQNALEQTLALYESGTGGFTREAAMDELAADFAGELWDSSEKLQDFIRKNYTNRTLLERVRDAFRALAAKLTGREKVQADEAVRLLEDALGAASEAVKTMELGTSRTEKGNKRFSLKAPLEETETLVALHNLNEDKMSKALDLGGFPMPSIAVTRKDIPHTNFGDISLVMSRDTVDPQKNRKNTVYSADAWTPTFPQIEYEANSKVESRVYRKLTELLEGVDNHVSGSAWQYASNLGDMLNRYGGQQGLIDAMADNMGMKAAYVRSKGVEIPGPETRETISRKSESEIALYDTLIQGLGEEAVRNIRKPSSFYGTGSEWRKQWQAENGDKLKSALKEYSRRNAPDLTEEEVNAGIDNMKLLTMHQLVRDASDYLRDGPEKRSTTTDYSEMDRVVEKEADPEGFRAWLEDLFDGAVKDSGVYNNKDRFTPAGNRRTFKQTHVPATLENIAKVMAGQNGGNTKSVTGFHGIKTLRAGTAKRFKSIKEMHDLEGRLQHLTEEEAHQVSDALADRMTDIMNRIVGEDTGDFFERMTRLDSIGETLMEVAESENYTNDNIIKTFGKYQYKVSDGLAQEIKELLFDTSQMPVNIFEAKPERAVRFDEVLAAVVPSDMDTGLRSRMEEAGMRLIDYERDNEQSRMDAVNSVEGARFSISAQDGFSVSGTTASYTEEDELRRVWANVGNGSYVAGGDAYTLGGIFNNLMVKVPASSSDTLTVYETPNTSGFVDGKYIVGDYTNAILENGNFVTYDKENKRISVANAVRNEIAILGGEKEPGVFYRVTNNKKEISLVKSGQMRNSFNHVNEEEELGVSVWDRIIYFNKKYAYKVTGEIVGVGSDGEPVLDPKTIKAVSPIKSIEDVKKQHLVAQEKGKQMFKEKYHWTDEQIEQALRGGYKRAYLEDVFDANEIRHSLAGGMDNARLLRENQKLRDRVEYWKGQTKKSDRAKVEPKEVKTLARRLATDFSSAMDRTEIAGELQAIYDGLGKDWTYDQAYEAAHALAMNMVEQASESDGFLYNEYEPMRVFFRETPLVISPEIKRGITDYNDWRKAQMGRLRLQSGEQSNIDQVYQEVSQLWPEWFDEEREATSLDQLERIVEVMDGIYTQEENNPFQDDLEGPAGYLAAEIMDSFWDLPNVKKTWADRAEARLGREVTRRLDLQEKYQEKLRQVREDRDRKLKEQSAAYLGRTKARSQRQKERERRAQIMRHARDLSKKLLKPSDKQHIPQQLREAVAAVLDSVNLASKNFKETNRTKAFQELRLAYQDILQQGESLVIDPDLMDNISEVEAMRDTPIAEMDLSQLETIWRTIRAVEASITTANKAFGQQRFATIFEAADGLQQAMGNRKDRGDYRGAVGAFDKLLNSGMLTPESYFHRMGQTGQDIFRMLRNAQDRHIGIMQEAQEYTEKIVGKTKVRKWEKEVHTFDFDGENVQLTTAQIMSLYELMKRQQAVDHIVVGGIKPEGVDRGVKKKAPSEPYRLTIDQISEIVDSLTEEQMAMADALQKYMGGRLAQLGNEASMAVYGYEKFNEKNYFPIKVDKNQTITDQTKEAQAATIAGRGFTKSTTPKANNALIVRNIFDVYADHVTDMATYSSWLEAMENLQRIYNFTFRDAEGNRTGTVKANLERAFGKNGLSYWEKLTEDLNNGVHGTNDNPFNSLIGNYKASAIGANIRVFIQQPTAILRALDDINPADFLAGLGRARPTTWSKVKKYAPIAVWKDWGYFDADTGRQMKSILFGDDSALAKVNNGLMAPAGAMDSLGWSHIWNALEAETRRTRKDLKPRTDEFYQAVAARFNAVIDHSQVVDGILQRSQVMRSPDALTKMATSFMAEPTKVYNMFTTAVYDLHHSQDPKARTQAMKVMGRTTFALIASFFANAAAQSLVDALRDDDKDEDYWEKFFQAFYGLEGDEETTGAKIKNGILEGNLGAAFNPATYIPWMKDVVSLAQGFKVSRMDMDSISKFVQEIGSTWKAFHGDGKITLQNALTRLTAEGARLLGIPASNIKRDVLAIYSTAMNSQNNYLGQFALQKWLYRLDNSNNWTDFVKIAYAAQQAGDTTAYEKIRAELVDAMGQEKYDEKMKNLSKKAMEAGGEQEEAFAGIYGTYETQMAGNPLYNEMPAEQRAKVEASLKQYAGDQVMQDASNGEITSADTEMAAIKEAEDAGIDPVTYKCFRVYYNGLASDKDANGEDIPGQTKQDKTIRAIEELELGKEKSSYLYHTCYSSDKNNPWA